MKQIMKISMLLGLFLIFGGLAGCKDQTPRGEVPVQVERPLISGPVETIETALTEVPLSYETTGTVQAKATVSVAARIMAEITSVLVREGERVKAGQPLLRLDDRDIRQQIAAAAAGVSEAGKALESASRQRQMAESTVQRYRKLFEQKAVTRQEMEQLETGMQVARLEEERLTQSVTRAEAGLAQAQVVAGYATVKSPAAGTVLQKMAEAGSMASPGQPLFTIEVSGLFHLEVAVDERFAGKVRLDMPVRVEIPSLPQTCAGVVTDIIADIEPNTRAKRVKISLENQDDLSSGLYARARFAAGSRQALLVPAQAVIHKGQLAGLFVVTEQNIVTYRLVRLGKTVEDQVEILSGLQPPEIIISSGIEHARDGGILQTEKKP